jgi:hypothetical protein
MELGRIWQVVHDLFGKKVDRSTIDNMLRRWAKLAIEKARIWCGKSKRILNVI